MSRIIVLCLSLLFALPSVADVAGVGNGTVNWTAPPNLGPARSGVITFTGDGGVVGTMTVSQASGCAWMIAPQSAAFAISGGSGSVVVTASDPACPAWTAKSNASWIALVAGGAVTYTVARNTGNTVSRVGTITVAGQPFTVTQAGKR